VPLLLDNERPARHRLHVIACSSCGSPVTDAARFCPTCGASVAATCPSCGSPVSSSARFCETCGHALAPAETGLEERKLVSILFADVTGSTALGERLDPERLREVLATYFSAMSAVIESWGGTVEKYIGDAIMAVFGAPVVREDDAVRALHAALEMLRRVAELNAGFTDRHAVELRLRIGVNTGEVVAPRASSRQMLVIGDAVNVAARLEQAAEPDSVLAGPTTFLSARDAFEFGEERALALKGKQERVSARAVLRPRLEVERGIPGLHTGMVGRMREFDALVDLMREATDVRRPRVALVVGPAGIGKSRLVLEFLRLAASRQEGLTILRGRCLAAGPNVTFWALGEVLREACGIALDEPAQSARERMSNVRDILGRLDVDDEDVDRTINALALTAGIALDDNPLDRYSPDAVDEELGRAWPRFATAVAQHGPTVLVIEDLHWASDRLLTMLERLASRSSGPLFILGTARPEFVASRPAFGAGSEEFSTISLRPLTEDQAVELLNGLLQDAKLPSRLAGDILARTEGNPFFIEEILRRLIDEGAIVHVGDHWQATDVAARVVLPETVHGLIAARIDTLPDDEKRVLQEAAVVGRVFWAEPVERALGNSSVQGHLAALERRGLVLARPTSSLAGQIEYAFRHALVREVAYAALPKSRRARAHADHAAWVERLAGDRVDEFADLIAHHYGAAVSGEDADLAWAGDASETQQLRECAYASLMRAGTLARKRYALGGAVELHELAVNLADDDVRRARALEELGVDHDAAYHGDEGVATYVRALELVRTGAGAGTEYDRARLCMLAARLACKMGASKQLTPPEAIEALIDEGLASVLDEPTRARLLQLRGEVALVYERFKRADPVGLTARIGSGHEALALAERLHDPELVAMIAVGLSSLYEMAGDMSRAYETIWRLGDVVDGISSPIVRAEVLLQYSWALISAGRFRDSVAPSRKAYDLGRDASAHAHMHGTCMRLQGAYYLGRWDEAREMAEEHASLYPEEAGVPCGAVNGGMFWGAVTFAHSGETERARQLLDAIPQDLEQHHVGPRAIAVLGTGDAAHARRIAESGLGELGTWGADSSLALLESLVALEDWDAVRSALFPSRERIPALPLLGPVTDRAEGALEVATGDSERGVGLLRSANEGFERMNVPFEVARTKELWARARPEERHDLLVQALHTYEELGARPHAERVRAVLTGE
jgi:class 3 adenylate cyclase/tetratricopeptide (TPR) repeat protein